MIVAALVAVESYAQMYPRNIISLRGGLNIASMSQRADGKRVGVDLRNPKVGWHIGAVDEVLLMDDMPLYLDFGVMLTNKGVRYVSENFGEGTSHVVKYRTLAQYGFGYLQFPVAVSYHLYFGDFTLQPYAGLHYDVGLWARKVDSTKLRSEADSSQNSDTKVVQHLYEQDVVRRSDFGFVLGVGATYLERYYFGVSWEDGFMNISKVKGLKLNQCSNLRITVGYNF